MILHLFYLKQNLTINQFVDENFVIFWISQTRKHSMIQREFSQTNVFKLTFFIILFAFLTRFKFIVLNFCIFKFQFFNYDEISKFYRTRFLFTTRQYFNSSINAYWFKNSIIHLNTRYRRFWRVHTFVNEIDTTTSHQSFQHNEILSFEKTKKTNITIKRKIWYRFFRIDEFVFLIQTKNKKRLKNILLIDICINSIWTFNVKKSKNQKFKNLRF